MRAKVLFLFCVSFYFGIANLHAQTTSEKDYCVVIGQFQKLEDAVKLTDEANLKGFSAQYALHHKKKRILRISSANFSTKESQILFESNPKRNRVQKGVAIQRKARRRSIVTKAISRLLIE